MRGYSICLRQFSSFFLGLVRERPFSSISWISRVSRWKGRLTLINYNYHLFLPISIHICLIIKLCLLVYVFLIIKQLKAVPCVDYLTFESLRKLPFKLLGRRRRPLYLYYLLKCVWLQCLKAFNIIYSSLLESLKLYYS